MPTFSLLRTLILLCAVVLPYYIQSVFYVLYVLSFLSCIFLCVLRFCLYSYIEFFW
jgi:hypothetical protein